jgi:hypothetical protein
MAIMNRANRITCPTCSAPLKSARGVRIGKKIKCPKCGIGFTVRPEDAEQAELGAGIDVGRFGVVLACAAIYLVGGTALALYCFAENTPPVEQTQAVAVKERAAKQTENDDTPPPPVPVAHTSLSAAEQLRVDRAIADGAWYLRDNALKEGGWGNLLPENQAPVEVGYACLPALALLECGVPPGDPVIQAAAKVVRAKIDQLNPTYDNYQRALAVLFLDRLDDKRDTELIQYLAVSLMLGQHPSGGAWTYRCPVPDRKLVPQLLRVLKDPKDVYASGAPKKQDEALYKNLQDEKQFMGAWRKLALDGGDYIPPAWDNSNTQFALLALWVAQRHGVAIERTIALAEHHFRTTQMSLSTDRDHNNLSLAGSWPYDPNGADGFRNSSRWPTMTCAGLLALAEAHGVTKDPKERNQKPLDDPAIQKGLAMLAREIDRPKESRAPDYYFLWSLERVGVLFDLPKIGGKDWYAWGCNVLLPLQQKNGSWGDGAYYGSADNPLLSTSFVLLFLKQANLVKSLTEKLQLLARVVTGTVQPPARKD